MDRKHIMFDRVPRKYGIGWENGRLVIKIHDSCIQAMQVVGTGTPWYKSAFDEFELGPEDQFFGDIKTGRFGINGPITRTRTEDNLHVFEVSLPRIWIDLETSCESCSGTGKRFQGDASTRDECLHCNGSGKAHEIDSLNTYRLSASLNLLFNAIEIVDVEPDTPRSQHVEVRIGVDRSWGGSYIGGYFGPEISSFLFDHCSGVGQQKLEAVLQSATRAMIEADKLMWTYRGEYDFEFRASLSDRAYLVLDCPGNACGLHHGNHDWRRSHGREFTCHNVDGPLQQLTLLAGLATFVDGIDRLMLGK